MNTNAAEIAREVRANAFAYHQGTRDHDTFTKIARMLWDEAARTGDTDAVKAALR